MWQVWCLQANWCYLVPPQYFYDAIPQSYFAWTHLWLADGGILLVDQLKQCVLETFQLALLGRKYWNWFSTMFSGLQENTLSMWFEIWTAPDHWWHWRQFSAVLGTRMVKIFSNIQRELWFEYFQIFNMSCDLKYRTTPQSYSWVMPSIAVVIHWLTIHQYVSSSVFLSKLPYIKHIIATRQKFINILRMYICNILCIYPPIYIVINIAFHIQNISMPIVPW